MGSFNFNVMKSAYYGDAFIKHVLTHSCFYWMKLYKD